MNTSYQYDFSVIIPHRNSLHFLPKLFSTLPDSEKIEIILVDNSDVPIKKEDVQTNKNFKLVYSSPERGAGGARNVGIDHSNGKWLVFVDADDYLPENAFETFYSQFNSDAELIFFCMDGIYSDTGEHSDRGDAYTQLVKDYLSGKRDEMDIRLNFFSPCSKMVRKSLVDKHHLRYDEVVAGNDAYFSLLAGYYATKIHAVDKVTYIATVSKGSLTKRLDFEVIKSRFVVNLRINKFLRDKKLSVYQNSSMIYIFQARNLRFNEKLEFVKLLVQYKQNPFIGFKKWFKTYLSYRKNTKRDKKYLTTNSIS